MTDRSLTSKATYNQAFKGSHKSGAFSFVGRHLIGLDRILLLRDEALISREAATFFWYWLHIRNTLAPKIRRQVQRRRQRRGANMFRRFGRSSVAISLLIYCAWLMPAVEAHAATAKDELARFSDKDFQRIESLARKGDGNAAALLGVAYEDGLRVQQDLSQAIRWYRQAAMQGDVKVQHHLALMYEQGKGAMPDFAEAARWYGKAASLGYAPSQCNLGNLYENGHGVQRDPAQAAKWYEIAARQGDAQAQSNIGYMYNHGEGVVHDDQQAVYWYRKAAEQGFAIAQRNLGVMYVLGQGVEANETEAMRWFAKAAELGTSRALVNEALLYMQGRQIQRDYGAAEALLSKAIAAGEQEATPLLKQCREYMSQNKPTTTTAQAH
jgi:TPR repeat protein